MKLVIKKDRLVKWPTTITQAMDGGKLERIDLNVTYKLINAATVTQLSADGHAINGDGDTPVVCAVVQEIEGLGLEDEAGVVVAFKPEMLPEICGNVALRTGLISGYFECVAGGVEKNV